MDVTEMPQGGRVPSAGWWAGRVLLLLAAGFVGGVLFDAVEGHGWDPVDAAEWAVVVAVVVGLRDAVLLWWRRRPRDAR